jgi:hypothetical protein
MEAFYNKKQDQYIFAAPRCGTSFLNSKVVKKLGWNKVNLVEPKLDHFPTIPVQGTTMVVKVIRDPYERWRSWFDTFVLAYTNINYWTLEQSSKWLDEFEKTIFLDTHIEKQSILLNSIKTNSSEIIYIRMEDLNIFLKISDQCHVINYRDRFESLPANTRHFFYYQIKKIYRDDYRWIKSLPIINF